MRPETRQCFADARAAAEETILLASAEWTADRTKSLAIERLLMIVGEALVRIRGFETSTLDELTDAHRFIGMRNVLVHGYDELDPARIEQAIRQNLPVLVDEIDTLLRGTS